MRPDYTTLGSVEDLTPATAATIAAMIAIGRFTTDPYRTAAGYGLAPALFDQALGAGYEEIARLDADPTAMPQQDLAGAVTLARFIGAVADVYRPAAMVSLYEAAERGDEEAVGILERQYALPWPEIRQAVEAGPEEIGNG
jgi:hypothetical protein